MSFSTTDPGQDFKAEAMDVFGKEKGKEMVLDDVDYEDDKRTDAGPLNEDLEPGEILNGKASKNDDPPVQVDDSRLHIFRGDKDLGWESPNDTSGSPSSCFPYPPLPLMLSSGSPSHFQPSDLSIIHHYQHPPIAHLNTSVPNEISINLPEAADRPKYLLSSTDTTGSKVRAVSVQMDTSEDSDMAADCMMKSLTMHSHKTSLGARTSGSHISSDQDSDQLPIISHK
ncbi:hypothetical protein CY34DRAFT_107841 [Suillus luteus UH-Slu-Lm8-n1]|uniref:Uncharacterized protein n=1 Tax=Suillus luteus UH-Slu-Lm8-n1 TaxID=930992 RepID=A0A0D0B193_9AGAM|nr:hypothetical protein CY34DRAFT_107841 [Suillus luteus UH-Slu-Lm8-n1]